MSQADYTAQRKQLVTWIGEIDRAIHDIAIGGTASASISAGGGSKSYTRINLAELRSLRAEYVERVAAIDRVLRNVAPGGIQHVITVRC